MLVCINAWQILDSCRPLGLRPMPVPKAAPILVPFRGGIPWTAVREYGAFHGLERDAVTLLVDVISYLDAKRAEQEASDINRKVPR